MLNLNLLKLLVIAAAFVSTLITTTTTVYAQQIPPPPSSPSLSPPQQTTTSVPTSATTKQILQEVHTNCSEVTPPVLTPLCVSVVHESPTTVVLTGNLLIVVNEGGGYTDNRFIWQAVDEFKARGATLSSILLTGEGTQGNPHDWYIVMSR